MQEREAAGIKADQMTGGQIKQITSVPDRATGRTIQERGMKFYLGTVIAFALAIPPWSGAQADANTIDAEKFKMTEQENRFAQNGPVPVEEKGKADPPGASSKSDATPSGNTSAGKTAAAATKEEKKSTGYF